MHNDVTPYQVSQPIAKLVEPDLIFVHLMPFGYYRLATMFVLGRLTAATNSGNRDLGTGEGFADELL